MNTSELSLLVDHGITLERQIDQAKKELDKIKATLTQVAYSEMDNKSLKYIQIFGAKGHYDVAYKEKLEIDNYTRLLSVVGEVAAANIARKENVKYEVKDRFKAALIAIFKQEFSQEISLDTVLQGLGLDRDAIKTAKKKLKGDYINDRKILDGFGVTGEYEEELYSIRLYKNYELVDRYFGELTTEQIEAVKKSIFIDDGLSSGFEYEDQGR